MRQAEIPWAVLVCAAIAGSLPAPADAQYIGANINVSAHYPTIDAVYDNPGNRIVSNAIEYPAGSYTLYNFNWQIDITANQMVLTWTNPGTGWFQTASFNGFVFTHALDAPLMQSATVDPASDFAPINVLLQANKVYLNYSGVEDVTSNARSIINFNVPEPAAATMCLSLGFTTLRRRQRAPR